ncbi:MAG: zf-TFIIB domain-containing protein [Candidatus Limnocylindria bacterium]
MTFATQPAVLLPCPKCTTPMRTIERSGIHLETCPECRGVFLDRGELDRLLDLEAASNDEPRRSVARGTDRPDDGERWQTEPRSERRRSRDDDDDDDDDRRERWSGGRDDGRRSSRRGGLLSDLFENFGG